MTRQIFVLEMVKINAPSLSQVYLLVLVLEQLKRFEFQFIERTYTGEIETEPGQYYVTCVMPIYSFSMSKIIV